MLKRVAFMFSAVVLITLLFAMAAGAAEFHADMTIQSEEGGEITGKVFVKGSSMRQELDTPMGTQVIIVDSDNGMMYVLMDAQKMYVERPNTQVLLDQSEDMEKKLAEQGTVKKLGSEKVEGFSCTKYHVVYDDTSLGESTLWVSKKLNYPLKVHVKNPQDTATIIYTNVSEKGQPDSLFQLPEGYSKIEM